MKGVKIAWAVIAIISWCHSANGASLHSHASTDSTAIEPAQHSIWRMPSLALAAHYGYLIPHRTEIQGLVKTHTRAFEINVEWLTTGVKKWHALYKRPYIGIDAWLCDPGNRELIGQQYGLIPYVRFPLRYGKRFGHDLKTGAGVGYTTKTWDLENNTKALFIGSPFNAAINLQYGMQAFVSDAISLSLGLRITHYSNGSFKTPNMGTNIVTLFAGCKWIAPTNRRDCAPPEINFLSVLPKRWNLQIGIGFGMKEISVPHQPRFPVYLLNLTESYRIGEKVSIGAGLDAFYTSSLRYQLELLDRDSRPNDALRLGLSGVFTMHFGKTDFIFATGGYFYDRTHLDGSVYSRVGLHYHFTPQLVGGFRLKTHFAKADHPEIMLGWCF
ncbi:MAG: acyloxyacyl hydrolase [Flavobacteriales bacterium]|nr:acyloxyacyl hydrolase [Flavobacteriales bacterium]